MFSMHLIENLLFLVQLKSHQKQNFKNNRNGENSQVNSQDPLAFKHTCIHT